MTKDSFGIPISSFFRITMAGHLIFAVSAIAIILLLQLLPIEPLIFISLPTVLLSIPTGTYFSWLMARGSNWENIQTVVMASSGLPGRFFGVVLGGSLGYRLFGTFGGIMLAIVFYAGAIYVSNAIGKILVRKMIPELIIE